MKMETSSYDKEYCAKPMNRRSPPIAREGNVLDTYPGNILYPHKLPDKVMTYS